MTKGWPSKYYLMDIIEAQKWDINELAIEAGIEFDVLESFLDKNIQSFVDEEMDKKLCKATNQPIGYFLDLDNKYIKDNK
ncbi:MAG: hypothetical protein ACRCUM_03400 [Mycoplasmoidaceae bacterium]